MKALITGVTGFAGSHLAEHLLSEGIEVAGTIRWRSKTDNIDSIKSRLQLIEANVRDSYSVERAIKEAQPDVIFHLAAQTFVPTSWHAPQETITTNVIGTINVLEAARRFSDNVKIHIAGSSEEYGLVLPNEVPIKETNPLRPSSPYAVTKATQDMLGFQYFRSYGMKIIVTRAFNHEGPRRGDVFVASSFAKQIAEMEKGIKDPVIQVGNLEARRDFSDVRDIVRAYRIAVEKCRPGEVYNICSGKSRSIKSVLDMLLSLSKVDGIRVAEDPKRMRPSDILIFDGDCSKFKKETGWEAQIPFEKTMKDLLDYWRSRV